MKNILYLAIISAILFTGLKLFESKNNLTIKNASGQTLNDVRIETTNGEQIVLGTISPDSKNKIKLPNSVNENALYLVYTDSEDKTYKEIIIGYLIMTESKNYNYIVN